MGGTPNNASDDGGLKGYITRHMLMGVVLAVVVIIALKIVLGFLEAPDPVLSDTSHRTGHDRVELKAVTPQASHQVLDTSTPSVGHEAPTSEGSGLLLLEGSGSAIQEKPVHGGETDQTHGLPKSTHTHTVPVTPRSVAVHEATATAQPADHNIALDHAPASAAAEQTAEGHGPVTPLFPVEGIAFVNALIQPLDNELNRRFYGWRPNDILNFTDNVNNFQLGVLEVTRRTAVILAERISRTGSTAAFDSDLENAMNWFMIKADRYWFPSAESKYRASLDEIRNYFHRLEKGEAQFYTRTDNLIPLLMAYQDLLGSSDENLVKSYEDDGSPVSYFKGDDYFFYAKGVATAMATILEGIAIDFNVMVERRGGMQELHHAIESCHHAMEIDPWVILNSDLSSIFANHRLNMAGPISHARFYLGVLIRALST